VDARQLLEALGGLRDGARGPARELFADAVTMSGPVTDRARDAPLSQAVQAAVTKGGDVALDGGAAQASDRGGLLAGQPAVQQPEHEHLAADVLLGVGVALGSDDLLLFLSQLNPKPSHPQSLGRHDQAELPPVFYSVWAPTEMSHSTPRRVYDRVIQRAIVEVLRPYLDPLFGTHSSGFRPRRGVLHALAHARHYFLTEGRSVWATADLRNAFHRVSLPRLLQVIKHYVFSEDVVEFINPAVTGAKTPGLRMGAPLSPFLLNLYLHHHLDMKWRELYPDIPLLRYADDILMVCKTTSEARKAHDNLVNLLLPTSNRHAGQRQP
jgi:Reverse transcriptase (RNA-dependent DNA polymerase)